MKISCIKFRLALIALYGLMSFLLVVAAVYPQDTFRLKPGAEGQICLKCHESFQKTLKSLAVHTPVKTGKCSDCHDPHTSAHKKLLSTDITRICNSCHKDVLPEKARSLHTIVAAGDCAKCHDSHASNNKFMLVKPANELCLECHQDVGNKAGQARFKHEPLVRGQGCLSCHNPHASTKADYLLKNEVPGLCVECHKTGQAAFIKKHLNYNVAGSDCDSCHSAHGSNSRGILYDTVHAPVAENKCTQCHFDPGSANAVRTRKQGVELCRQCHQAMINETFNKNRVHWALLDNTACLNCHDPHGSKLKKLLDAPLVKTCGKCHADTVKLQEWSIDNPKNKGLCEPVKTGNCVSCHSPHAADYILLMPQENVSTGICGKCHEWETHSTHPIGEKVADPRDKNLSVECLSCHKACGTGNKPAEMPFETTYDLCIQCHPERRR